MPVNRMLVAVVMADVVKVMRLLPSFTVSRFAAEYGLPVYDAEVLTARKDIADYFEAAVREIGRASCRERV